MKPGAWSRCVGAGDQGVLVQGHNVLHSPSQATLMPLVRSERVTRGLKTTWYIIDQNYPTVTSVGGRVGGHMGERVGGRVGGRVEPSPFLKNSCRTFFVSSQSISPYLGR